MKLREGVISCPPVGVCDLDLDAIVRIWPSTTVVSRWHDEFRLVNLRANVKVSISQVDAEYLISKLGLVASPSPIFRNATVYRSQSEQLAMETT